jgi:hypothetical protein
MNNNSKTFLEIVKAKELENIHRIENSSKSFGNDIYKAL